MSVTLSSLPSASNKANEITSDRRGHQASPQKAVSCRKVQRRRFLPDQNRTHRLIQTVTFERHTPPYSTLDIEALSAKNSRRQDATTVYGDLDRFTPYVGRNIVTDTFWHALGFSS